MKNLIQEINSFSLAINSSIIAITTFIIATLLHEISHFMLSFILGLNAELHHNFVSVNNVSKIQEIYIAGIGPLMSMFLGIIFLILSKKIVFNNFSKIKN